METGSILVQQTLQNKNLIAYNFASQQLKPNKKQVPIIINKISTSTTPSSCLITSTTINNKRWLYETTITSSSNTITSNNKTNHQQYIKNQHYGKTTKTYINNENPHKEIINLINNVSSAKLMTQSGDLEGTLLPANCAKSSEYKPKNITVIDIIIEDSKNNEPKVIQSDNSRKNSLNDNDSFKNEMHHCSDYSLKSNSDSDNSEPKMNEKSKLKKSLTYLVSLNDKSNHSTNSNSSLENNTPLNSLKKFFGSTFYLYNGHHTTEEMQPASNDKSCVNDSSQNKKPMITGWFSSLRRQGKKHSNLTTNSSSNIQRYSQNEYNGKKSFSSWDLSTNNALQINGKYYGTNMKLKDELCEVASEMETMENSDENKLNNKTKMMSIGRKKFNMDPKKGIEYLVEKGLLKNTPEDIAQFLYKGDGLNKTAIGDYLGERNDFNEAVLKAFVDLHDFTDLILVQALRQFLWSFRLPGEAQKIDRMMECFAQRYCQLNRNIFTNTDTCYVLSFAIIMLNTSLHNPSVKEKTTPEQFIAMNRGIDNGGDLPKELLQSLYDSIKTEPFKIPEDDGYDLMHTFFNPDKEGWLWKQGGRYKSWKRRWFILNDNCLYYFEYTTDKEPRGIIPLENISVREATDRHKPHCFELYASGGADFIKACKTDFEGKVVEGKHTVYRMSAATAEEKVEWMNSLKHSISHNPFYDMLAQRKKKAQFSNSIHHTKS